MTRASLLYLASFAAHGALAIGVVSLKGTKIYDAVAIAVVESKKAKPKDDTPPPPPPPAPEPPKETAKAKAAPKAIAPPPPAEAPAAASPGADAPAAPDFGLSLGGSGGAGLAVPKGTPSAAPKSEPTAVRKVLAAPAPAADECNEALKKPKVTSITQPAYTSEAREASIAGKVRVEVTVDASGRVASARVLEGLGHGLDEAALAAARSATFEPGTRCGRPVSATFVIAIRFAL